MQEVTSTGLEIHAYISNWLSCIAIPVGISLLCVCTYFLVKLYLSDFSSYLCSYDIMAIMASYYT